MLRQNSEHVENSKIVNTVEGTTTCREVLRSSPLMLRQAKHRLA